MEFEANLSSIIVKIVMYKYKDEVMLLIMRACIVFYPSDCNDILVKFMSLHKSIPFPLRKLKERERIIKLR
jgi:hypothetical protein